MSSRFRSLALAVTLVIGACAMDNGTSSLVERHDSAGITVVDNLAPDRELGWTTTVLASIGGQDEGPGAFFRVNGQGLAGDAQGRIFVLDIGTAEISIFDEAGIFVRKFGGQGGGPGEMKSPVSLHVEQDGALGVYDAGKGAFIRFDTTGAVLPEVTLAGIASNSTQMPVPVPGGIVAAGPDSVLSPGRDLAVGDPFWRPVLMFGSDQRDPRVIAVLEGAQPPFTPIGSATCPITLKTPPVFTALPQWHTGSKHLLHPVSPAYVVNRTAYSGERTSIRRDLPLERGTREAAALEIGDVDFELNGASCSASGDERAMQAGWTDVIPWVKRVTEAPTGEVFVLRRTPGVEPGARMDVFAPDGTYTGTLSAAIPFPAAWHGTGFLTVERDDDDRAIVVSRALVR